MLAAVAFAQAGDETAQLREVARLLDDGELDAGRTRLAPLLASADPATRLRAEVAQVRIEMLSGRFSAARERAEALLPRLQATLGGSDRDTLTLRHMVAAADERLDRFEQAKAELAVLAPDIAAAFGESDPLYRRVVRTRIAVLANQGAINEALVQAQALFRSLDAAAAPATEVWRSALQIAQIADLASDYEAVLQWSERAARGLLESEGPHHPYTREAARMRAVALGELGDPEGAARLLETTVRDIDAHPGIARIDDGVRRLLARYLLLLDRPGAAVGLLQQVAAAAPEVDRFDVDVELARAQLAAGALAEGCRLAQRGFAAARAEYEATRWERLRAEHVYAQCLIARGELDAAAALLAENYAATVRRNGADNTDSLDVLARRAALELRRGAKAQARALLVSFVAHAEAARAAAAAASATRRSQFARWAASDESAAGYSALARLVIEEGDPAESLRLLELARARRIGDAIAIRAAAPGRWLDEAELRRLRAAEDALAVAEAAAARRDTDVRADLRRTEAAKALAQLRQELAARHPQYGARLAPRLADGPAARSALRKDEAFVALQVLEDQAGAVVITQARTRVLDLGRIDGLDALVAALGARGRGQPVRLWRTRAGGYRTSLARPDDAEARVPAARAASVLAQRLWRPIERALGSGLRRITISPDGAVAALPFELLPSGPGLLASRFELAYAPSLTSFVAERRALQRPQPLRRVLAIGAPDYAALAAAGGESWSELPGAQAELRMLATVLGRERVTTIIGPEATAERLRAMSRDGSLRAVDVLHVAAHAELVQDAPERSALILGLEPGAAPESASVVAPEIAALRLGARLVVLSACDTAGGRWQPGEGILGLPQAIFTASGATTVLTRWAVDDAGAATFMRRFYRQLEQGHSAVAALARARAEARSRRDADRDARVWAAFVAYGAW